MSISFLNHNGEPVMFADYTECLKGEQQLELLEQVASEMPAHGVVRLLVDYSGIKAGIN